MVNSVPSPGQLRYQTNQIGAFLHYGPAVFLNGDICRRPIQGLQPDATRRRAMGARGQVVRREAYRLQHETPQWILPLADQDDRLQRPQFPLEKRPGRRDTGTGRRLQKTRDRTWVCTSPGTTGIFPAMRSTRRPWPTAKAYWPVYRRQIEELLTDYGDIVCLWLDHYGDPFSWPAKLAINPKTASRTSTRLSPWQEPSSPTW